MSEQCLSTCTAEGPVERPGWRSFWGIVFGIVLAVFLVSVLFGIAEELVGVEVTVVTYDPLSPVHAPIPLPPGG